MSVSFFMDWALWEEMSFILACLIILVFLAGLVKLKIDERNLQEKLAGTLRRDHGMPARTDSGGPLLQAGAHRLPFGVRALESGILVEGIWDTRSLSTAPSSLKSIRAGHSSETSLPSNSHHNNKDLAIKDAPSITDITPGFRSMSVGDSVPSGKFLSTARKRPEYKPRRSSQLRHSSYGDPGKTEEDGCASATKPNLGRDLLEASCVNTASSRSLTPPCGQSESAPSPCNSSESSRSLASDSQVGPTSVIDTTQPKVLGAVYGLPIAEVPEECEPQVKHYQSVTPSCLGADSPLTTLGRDALVRSGSVLAQCIDDVEMTAGAGLPLLPLMKQNYALPTMQQDFASIRQNRAARKVNSTFELLPAGTFGTPSQVTTSIDVESGTSQSKRGGRGRRFLRKISIWER